MAQEQNNSGERTIPTLNKPDERAAAANTAGLALCGCAAICYVAVRIIWVGFHGKLAIPELVLLFVMVGLLALANMKSGVAKLPRVFGKELSAAPQDRLKRIGMYALESAVISVAWTILDSLTEKLFGNFIVDFLVCFVICFVIALLIGEFQVKRYLKQLTRE